jgi:predicted PurR-regulated permease PerM
MATEVKLRKDFVPAEPKPDRTNPAPPIEPQRPVASQPLVIIAALAVIAALYFARDIVIPVVLALLLALLLKPILRRMQTWHLPDIVSAFILVAAVVLMFGLGVATLAGQAQQWLADAPEVLTKARQLLPARSGPLTHLKKASDAVENITRDEETQQPLKVQPVSQDTMMTALGVSTQFVGSAVITFVLAFFLLAFNKTLLNQAVESRDTFNEKRNVVELLRNIETGISRYLFTVTAINIGLGVTAGLILWFLEIPNPVLWGVLIAVMNFVPHVGAFICMAVLFLVGAVSHQSMSYGLLTAGVFVILTSIESYFVTPLVLSRSLQLSPLAIILAILFWGWLWGIAGGLMAAPLLAILKITCDQFDSLHGLGAFLSGESRESNGGGPQATSTASA